MPEINNNYYSEEVDEIIGKMPSRIIRYGNGVILLTLTMILLLSIFIKYNDVINAPVSLYFSGDSYNGYAMLKSSGYGKIKVGQKIIIKVDSYPVSEFGFLTGIVSYKDNKLTGDKYKIEISIPTNITNKGIVLNQLKEMNGYGEIIIGAKPVLTKLITPLMDLVN